MANKVQAKNATVEVRQFENGYQGGNDTVGFITATVYVNTVHAPAPFSMCTSAMIEERTFYWINYAGKRIEVEPPNIDERVLFQHSWRIHLSSFFEHPLKAQRAQAEEAAARLNGERRAA